MCDISILNKFYHLILVFDIIITLIVCSNMQSTHIIKYTYNTITKYNVRLQASKIVYKYNLKFINMFIIISQSLLDNYNISIYNSASNICHFVL